MSMRNLQPLVDKAIDGILLYGADKVAQFINNQFYAINKTTKNYGDAVIKLGMGFVIDAVPQLSGTSQYVKRFADVSFIKGTADIVKQFIDKPPFLYAQDASTIIVYNLDTATPNGVYVDGSALQSNAYTVSGSADNLTIKLNTPLQSGQHYIMVVGAKVSAYGQVKV